MSHSTITKKTTESLTLITTTTTATLKTLIAAIGTLPEQLMQDIQDAGIAITGPALFEYIGCSEDIDKEFTLNICFPVASGTTYAGNYTLVTTEPFICLETEYKGTLADLGSKGWAPFMQGIMKDGTPLTDISREVYVKWDGPESSDNVVLLQMGIQ
ncbi:MAG: hypothetical protein OCD01_00230 [Fibrobacterales bacterium]